MKTLGSATTRQEIERIIQLAEQEIKRLSEPLPDENQKELFNLIF